MIPDILPSEASYGVCFMKIMEKIECVITGADCIDGLAQDCSNSSANALELLQSWAKPSVW